MNFPRTLICLVLLGVVPERAVSVEVEGPSETRPLAIGLSAGQLFPDLRLPTLEGGELRSLRDYRGKKILLHIFASW
jgi:hypothetical protein